MTFSSQHGMLTQRLDCLFQSFCLNFSYKINLPTNQSASQPTSQDGATSHMPIGLSKKGISTSTELKESVFQ